MALLCLFSDLSSCFKHNARNNILSKHRHQLGQEQVLPDTIVYSTPVYGIHRAGLHSRLCDIFSRALRDNGFENLRRPVAPAYCAAVLRSFLPRHYASEVATFDHVVCLEQCYKYPFPPPAAGDVSANRPPTAASPPVRNNTQRHT